MYKCITHVKDFCFNFIPCLQYAKLVSSWMAPVFPVPGENISRMKSTLLSASLVLIPKQPNFPEVQWNRTVVRF